MCGREEELPSLTCILLLTLITVFTSTISMVSNSQQSAFSVMHSLQIVSELSGPIVSDPFLFIMVKYVVGTFTHFLVPLAVLVVRADLRELVGVVYRKGGTNQDKAMEMTYEEMQRELGLGVEVR